MRVVIAEDLFLLRDGLTRLLEAHGLQIAAAVDNGADLLTAVAADAPDVAIVDVRLDLQPSDDDNRRVLAVLAYLGGLYSGFAGVIDCCHECLLKVLGDIRGDHLGECCVADVLTFAIEPLQIHGIKVPGQLMPADGGTQQSFSGLDMSAERGEQYAQR